MVVVVYRPPGSKNSKADQTGNGLGRSFSGLSRYVISGKPGELNADRAAWIEGLNVVHPDLSQAWSEMVDTCDNQVALKKEAKQRGLIAKNARVDQIENTPVSHTVASWKREDGVTKARMMEFVRAYLESEGLSHHQTLVVCHKDAGGDHIHIMTNLVDPDTGLSAKDRVTRKAGKNYGRQMRASAFCVKWEAAHPDETPCSTRAANWAQRRENSKAWDAHKTRAAANTAFGAPAPEAPKLQKVYDRSPKRHVWLMMKGIRSRLSYRLAGHPDAANIADRAARRFAAAHRKRWSRYYREGMTPAPMTVKRLFAAAATQMEMDLRKAITALAAVFNRSDVGPARNATGRLLLGHEAALQRVGVTAAPRAAVPAPDVGAVLRTATRHQSTFTRGQLAKAVHSVLGGHATAGQFAALMAKVEASPDLVRLGADPRGPWVYEKGGFDALKPEQQRRAREAWEKWRTAEKWHSYGLPQYVAYVQDRTPAAHRDRFTSRAMYETETRLLANGILMAGSQNHAIPGAILDGLAKRTGYLNDEQRAALTHLLNPAALSIAIGVAGAGKSTTMKHAREALEAAGYTVRGVVYSGKLAQQMEADTGITTQTYAAFRQSVERGKLALGPKTAVLVDEAGMLGSEQTAWLLDVVRATGAKINLVGDFQQLQAIEAGGPLRALATEKAIGAARMTTVMRQGGHVRGDKEKWAAYEWQRQATRAFAAGKAAAAFSAYVERGHVHGHDTRTDARAAVVSAWFDDMQKPGLTSLMIAATIEDVAALNREARQRMVAAGRVAGSQVITACEETPDTAPRDFKMEVGVGERLMFRKNDNALGVKNGTLGTVERISGRHLHMILDGETPRRVVVDRAAYRHFRYGYATTAHSGGQGATVDTAHVLATKTHLVDAHWSYVALSRHRQGVSVHFGKDDFSDTAALTRQAGRQHLKHSTTDYLEPAARVQAQRRALGADMRRLAGSGTERVAKNAMAQLTARNQTRSATRRRDTSRSMF